MTLGSGAWHSEQNGSETEPMRFIQMWILPDTIGLPPEVEQRVYTREERTDRMLRVFSAEGGDAVKVHGDASVYVARLNPGTEVDHGFGEGRGGYLYAIEGVLGANEEKLGTGDAAKIRDEDTLRLRAEDTSELILVDVSLD
jgi:redox-sensitive bicupin YhaK (pirin superfamily)